VLGLAHQEEKGNGASGKTWRTLVVGEGSNEDLRLLTQGGGGGGGGAQSSQTERERERESVKVGCSGSPIQGCSAQRPLGCSLSPIYFAVSFFLVSFFFYF